MSLELTTAQREILRAPDSRMDAYYYGFDRTGAPAIDAILSAVAYAGKAFHGTDQWYETDVNYGPITGGMSAADVIQAAANEAAALVAQVERLQGFVDDLAEYGVRHDLNPTIDLREPGRAYTAYIERIDKSIRERAEVVRSGSVAPSPSGKEPTA